MKKCVLIKLVALTGVISILMLCLAFILQKKKYVVVKPMHGMD